MATFIQGTGVVYAPTPSTPIPVNVVTGDNTITICGKNLFDGEYETGYININTGAETPNANVRTKNYIRILPNTQYAISNNISHDTWACYYDKNKAFISNQRIKTGTSGTFTTPNDNNIYYVRWYDAASTEDTPRWQLEYGNTASTYEAYQSQTYPIYLGVENLCTNVSQQTVENLDFYVSNKIQQTITLSFTTNVAVASNSIYLNIDGTSYGVIDNLTGSANTKITKTITLSQANYEAIKNGTTIFLRLYKSGANFTIPTDAIIENGTNIQHVSSTPLELCKIGNYQDYIYKDNGSWYIHKEIGKVVLEGTEGWYVGTRIDNTTKFFIHYNHTPRTSVGASQSTSGELSDNFIQENPYTYVGNAFWVFDLQDATQIRIGLEDTSITTVTALQTWLSNHNTTIYYPLLTPTNTIITDTELITQLDNMENAMSYTGQTNISQENNDKPFIIKAITMEGGSDEAIINNIGNTYAKPTIDIEGNGIVNVYLNGNQIFAVNVTDEVVINSTNLEAYNPNTSALENRKVTGNIANLKLNTGTNTLKFSGNLTKATITDYVRYL